MEEEKKTEFRDRRELFAEEEEPGCQEDDGRTIADMNVEGMPWYQPHKREREYSKDDLSKREARQFIISATLTGLLVACVFAAVIILFTLFCTQIWFR